MADPDLTAKADLAYREVVRSVELQERTLDALRGRAGLILSTAFVLAAFAANATHVRGHWWWFGVILMVPLAGLVVFASWSVNLWATNSGYLLVAIYVDDEGYALADMYRDLALYGQADFNRNERALRWRRRALTASVFLLAAEAAAFLAAAHVAR